MFPGRRKVIFIHGCFWHQHPGCREGRPPKSNAAYWLPKLERNIERDKAALAQLHILAYGDDLDGLEELLVGTTTDASVMDVRSFLRLITGLLKKPAREVALRRLYELIERNQPEVDRVNAYVALLRSHSLAA